MVTQNLVACRLPTNFVDPELFIPERWLKEEKSKANTQTNPYLVLPFGHGMRACIARRLAEQNILVLVIRVSFRFQNTMSIRLHYSRVSDPDLLFENRKISWTDEKFENVREKCARKRNFDFRFTVSSLAR